MSSNYFQQYVADMLLQIFDVIQSDITIQKQLH